MSREEVPPRLHRGVQLADCNQILQRAAQWYRSYAQVVYGTVPTPALIQQLRQSLPR